jgi:dipeptidyl aminopeptidase/acylaminoacyl peptidase
MPDLNSYWIRGGGGDLVHCWYLPPCDGRKVRGDASVPLVLVIHGGPQGAIMNSFHYRWNMCSYAARGFGVVAVNFHGSTSYGQGFCDSIRNDWGGKPFDDNMAAVDYVLNQHKYLDSSRVAALGASYGGYMINWINGHTDRYYFYIICIFMINNLINL